MLTPLSMSYTPAQSGTEGHAKEGPSQVAEQVTAKLLVLQRQLF